MSGTTIAGLAAASMPATVTSDTLDESYVSINEGLVFPNVRSCMALVVRSTPQGRIAGYHTTIATTGPEMEAVADVVKTALGKGFSEMYLLGSVSMRAGGGSVASESRYRVPLVMLLRRVFDYAGQIRTFDTSQNNLQGWVFHAWRDPKSNATRLAGGIGGAPTAPACQLSAEVRRWRHAEGKIVKPPIGAMSPRIWTPPATIAAIPTHLMATL